MKNAKHIIDIIAFFVIFAMTMSGCKKESIKPIDSVSIITKPVTEITLTSAKCGGDITSLNSLTFDVVGICWGENENPTLQDAHSEGVLSRGASFTVEMLNLKSGETYHVRAYVKVGDDVTFGNDRVFTVEDGIDLGLPSGTKWAPYNIGATTPEEYGDYFAWGETETKRRYKLSTYKWNDDTYNWLTKYNYTDNKTVLDIEDDVARARLGGNWRIPTREDIEELLENCSYQWVETNGVKGCYLCGQNGNSLFFPAAGYYQNNVLTREGNLGVYWSCTLHDEYKETAFDFNFGNSKAASVGHFQRERGVTVRAVYSPEN